MEHVDMPKKVELVTCKWCKCVFPSEYHYIRHRGSTECLDAMARKIEWLDEELSETRRRWRDED